MKICPSCHIEFDDINNPQWKRKIYCSTKCQRIKFAYQNTPWIKENKISKSTVGAIAELIASADLMSKGFQVYRALSPSSDCDILAEKEHKVYKFEIRTGRYNWKGSLTFPPKSIKAPNLIIITHNDKKIHYVPPISSLKRDE